MNPFLVRVFAFFLVMLCASCATLSPKYEQPDVKVAGVRVLPSHGLLNQHIAIDLLISNPNRDDLNVRGINYQIGIESINVLSGVTDTVPVLKSYQETPVTLEVTVDVLQMLRLVEHFSREGVGENVNYNFSAAIDFSRWLPTMHVDRKGAVPLSKIVNR